ncbi:MAG: efflux RND transporter permease subunit, partial [Chloroflexi bacterium]|nr:efflux RND transporter permease subunit [Chloroflexota bacterium]
PVGRPLGDVASDVQHTVNSLALPDGVTITLRGQVQTFNLAIQALGSALVLSLVLEYMLLVALYESWLFPLVRMLTVPLGMVGAFLLLWATGNTINIFSIIGMIMGEGLVAKSGILLVDYTNTLRERGWERLQALQESVRVRLRPILMTSATMIFGMLPLALKLEEGAETRAPMAVVVIGALLSSTLLTLVVVPSLYTVVDDIQNKFSGRKPVAPPTPAEPARAEVAAGLVEHAAAEESNGHANGAHIANGANGAAVAHASSGDVDSVPLDIFDRGDVYVVQAALPGVRHEDVQVTVRGHTLTIYAQRSEHDESNGDRVVQEHARGHWERSFTLPHEVDEGNVTASYKDGILELRLAKAALEPPRRIAVGYQSSSDDAADDRTT